MTSSASDSDLPGPVTEAARQSADILFSALSPARARDPESPGLAALWDITKMLNAVSGSLDGFCDVPEADRLQAQWYEALLQAESIANRALTQIAVGLTPEQAAGWLEEKDAIGAGMETLGTGGTIELIGPDVMETDRTLTVAIGDDRLRTPAVIASRGPAPEPRPQTPSCAPGTI